MVYLNIYSTLIIWNFFLKSKTKKSKHDFDIVLLLFQALDRIPLIRATINVIVDFIRDRVARWIMERGGWVGHQYGH